MNCLAGNKPPGRHSCAEPAPYSIRGRNLSRCRPRWPMPVPATADGLVVGTPLLGVFLRKTIQPRLLPHLPSNCFCNRARQSMPDKVVDFHSEPSSVPPLPKGGIRKGDFPRQNGSSIHAREHRRLSQRSIDPLALLKGESKERGFDLSV